MGADLENADLSDAQLQKADLTMANGHGAILTDAYLIEAKLFYAIPTLKVPICGVLICAVFAHADQPPEADLFASVNTLYQAHLDEPLQKQLKRAHPHLFSKPQGSGDGDN
jgi:uncharacterized protein YjbI with pentapeptide repeats